MKFFSQQPSNSPSTHQRRVRNGTNSPSAHQRRVRNGKVEANLFARRALVGFLGVLVLTGVLLANIYHLQVSDYQDYRTRSNGNRIKLLPILDCILCQRKWMTLQKH